MTSSEEHSQKNSQSRGKKASNSSKLKFVKKYTTQSDVKTKSHINKPKNYTKEQGKEWEAARRRRFNDVIELLRLELPDCVPCPKVEVIQSALNFVKQQKSSRIPEQNGLDLCDSVEKLKKQILVFRHILKEAGITIKAIDKDNLSYNLPVTCDDSCSAPKKKTVINFSVSNLNAENFNCFEKSFHESVILDKGIQTENPVLSSSGNSSSITYSGYLVESAERNNLARTHFVNSGLPVIKVRTSDSYQKEITRIEAKDAHINSLANKVSNERIIVDDEVKNGTVTVNIISESPNDIVPAASLGNSSTTAINQPSLALGSLAAVNVPTSNPVSSRFEAGSGQRLLSEDFKHPSVLSSESQIARVLKLPSGINHNMIILRCNSGKKTILKANGEIFTPSLTEPHLTLVTPSLSNAPIMSTGLPAFLSQKGIYQSNSIIPVLFNAPLVTVQPSGLKRIAPKPSKDVGDKFSSAKTFSSTKKSAPVLKISPKLQYKRKKHEDEELIPQVQRTDDVPQPDKEDARTKVSGMSSATSVVKTDCSQPPTNCAKNSNLSESYNDLETMMDLTVDMPCVISEGVGEGTGVSEDGLVEMLRSMDEEDRSFTLPSSSSNKLPHSKSSNSISNTSEENDIYTENNVVGSNEIKNSLTTVDVNEKVISNVHVSNEVLPGINNYSIMSLCISSKTTDEIVSENMITLPVPHSSSDENSKVESYSSAKELNKISLSDKPKTTIATSAKLDVKESQLVSHKVTKANSSSNSGLSIPSLISQPIVSSKGFDLPPVLDIPTSNITPLVPGMFLHRHSFANPPLPPIALPVLSLSSLSSCHPTTAYSFSLSSTTTTDTISTASVPSIFSKASNTKPPIASSVAKSPLLASKTNADVHPTMSNYSESHCSSEKYSVTKTSKGSFSEAVSTSNERKLSFPISAVSSSRETPSVTKSIFSLAPISSYTHPFQFCGLSISDAPTTFSFTLTKTSNSSPTISSSPLKPRSSDIGSNNKNTNSVSEEESHKKRDVENSNATKTTQSSAKSKNEATTTEVSLNKTSLSSFPTFSLWSSANTPHSTSFTYSLPLSSTVLSTSCSSSVTFSSSPLLPFIPTLTSKSYSPLKTSLNSTSIWMNDQSLTGTNKNNVTNTTTETKVSEKYSELHPHLEESSLLHTELSSTRMIGSTTCDSFPKISNESNKNKDFQNSKLNLLPVSSYLDSEGYLVHPHGSSDMMNQGSVVNLSTSPYGKSSIESKNIPSVPTESLSTIPTLKIGDCTPENPKPLNLNANKNTSNMNVTSNSTYTSLLSYTKPTCSTSTISMAAASLCSSSVVSGITTVSTVFSTLAPTYSSSPPCRMSLGFDYVKNNRCTSVPSSNSNQITSSGKMIEIIDQVAPLDFRSVASEEMKTDNPVTTLSSIPTKISSKVATSYGEKTKESPSSHTVVTLAMSNSSTAQSIPDCSHVDKNVENASITLTCGLKEKEDKCVVPINYTTDTKKFTPSVSTNGRHESTVNFDSVSTKSSYLVSKTLEVNEQAASKEISTSSKENNIKHNEIHRAAMNNVSANKNNNEKSSNYKPPVKFNEETKSINVPENVKITQGNIIKQGSEKCSGDNLKEISMSKASNCSQPSECQTKMLDCTDKVSLNKVIYETNNIPPSTLEQKELVSRESGKMKNSSLNSPAVTQNKNTPSSSDIPKSEENNRAMQNLGQNMTNFSHELKSTTDSQKLATVSQNLSIPSEKCYTPVSQFQLNHSNIDLQHKYDSSQVLPQNSQLNVKTNQTEKFSSQQVVSTNSMQSQQQIHQQQLLVQQQQYFSSTSDQHIMKSNQLPSVIQKESSDSSHQNMSLVQQPSHISQHAKQQSQVPLPQIQIHQHMQPQPHVQSHHSQAIQLQQQNFSTKENLQSNVQPNQQTIHPMNDFNSNINDIIPERKTQQHHQQQIHHSPMGTSTSCAYPFDYNQYYKKNPQSPRSESKQHYYGYNKQSSQYHYDILPDPSMVQCPPGPPIIPPFIENEDLSMRVIEDSPADPVRYFSVSHLVSPFSEGRKTGSNVNSKDQNVQGHLVAEEKAKDTSKGKSSSRKSDAKSRGSGPGNNKTTLQANDSRRRSPARGGSGQPSNNNNNLAMWSKNSSANKQGNNYSAEALISSQTYSRSSQRHSVNQNYHFIPPNQMYQSTYSPHQMKNFVQNAPFGYGGHDRGPTCNSDYNFQLPTQPPGSLPYGHNMTYMASGYPYQNLPPSSPSILPGEIMPPPHHSGSYPKLHDIGQDHGNFSNAAFALQLDPQDMCGGSTIGSSNVPTMCVRPEPPFGISSVNTKVGPIKGATSGVGSSNSQNTPSKRSRYNDNNIIAPTIGTPTNFFDGSALSHISLHSFTPPCEDPSLMHPNFFPGSSRHQSSNFFLGPDNFMPINSTQHLNTGSNAMNIPNPSSSSESLVSGSAAAGGMSSVPVARGAPHAFPLHSSSGHLPFNHLKMSDRQQVNMGPLPIASHLSSSLANFNLTSIIPEIDGKNDDTNVPVNPSPPETRNALPNSNHPSAMPSQQRPSVLTDMSKSVYTSMSHPENPHRFPPPVLNESGNNLFSHSHQVGLSLNSTLPLPTSTFSSLNFPPTET